MLTDDWTDKLAAMKPYEWRVGRKVPINVYEGERPICQCHTAMDAARIVASMRWESEIIRLRSELLDARKEIERSTTAQVAAVQMVLEGADGSLINGRIGEPLRAIAAKLAAVPEKIELSKAEFTRGCEEASR